jgi:hypothetical protein
MLHRFKTARRGSPHRIEVFVDKIEQLFNSMDPSPFHEKDLDRASREPDHRRLGGDVASDANFPLRMVAGAPYGAFVRKDEPNACRSAKANRIAGRNSSDVRR